MVIKDKEDKVVKIEKIVLKVGDKTLELTPDEVKGLKEVLDKMFGNNSVVTYYYPNYYPYITYPVSPNWTYTSTDYNVAVSGSTTIDKL